MPNFCDQVNEKLTIKLMWPKVDQKLWLILRGSLTSNLVVPLAHSFEALFLLPH